MIINRLIGPPALFTVKESTTRPSGAAAGPYSTQAEAQAKANSLNHTAASANPLTSPATNPLTGVNAIGDLATRLTKSETWVRVGEFLAGGMLLYVGAKAFFPTTVNTITSGAKKAGKAAAFL